MDNLTHSLVGAALADVALRETPGRAGRRLFLATGVIASNLPDIDLVYTGVSPAPLGYLLHHRGHTHTVAGLIAQALVIAAVCLAPPLRRAIRDAGAGRFWALVAASLAFHLVLDSWNTYGVHPFWPLDARWYYGDAIFIFEPWLWLFLGMSAAANARSGLGRMAVAGVVAALCVALDRRRDPARPGAGGPGRGWRRLRLVGSRSRAAVARGGSARGQRDLRRGHVRSRRRRAGANARCHRPPIREGRSSTWW